MQVELSEAELQTIMRDLALAVNELTEVLSQLSPDMHSYGGIFEARAVRQTLLDKLEAL